MEDILTQRFSFATITPYRDYCTLKEKENNYNTFGDSDIDLLNDADMVVSFKRKDYIHLNQVDPYFKPVKGVVTSLPERKPRRVFYFDTTDTVQEKFKIKYAYLDKFGNNSFETQKDQQIKRHYGRPFSSIEIRTIERSIRKNGDKITIKVYYGYKNRGFNCKYFKSGYNVITLSVNIRTGNFTVGVIEKTSKRKTTRFRVNSFEDLNRTIRGNGFFKIRTYLSDKSKFRTKFDEEFDNTVFSNKINSLLNLNMKGVNYEDDHNQFISDLIRNFFIVKKNIKVPDNNYDFLITRLYPTEKYLKKNDRKLVASVLDMLGLKSKILIKIVHKYPNIDFTSLLSLKSYFGSDFSKYIGNINPDVFENSFRKDFVGESKAFLLSRKKDVVFYLLEEEKENLLKLINSSTESRNMLNETHMQLINDHFIMIDKIRNYDPDCKMKTRNYEDFTTEHSEFTKILAAIRKGWVIEYQYDIKTIEELQQPLDYLINSGTENEPLFEIDLSMKGQKLIPRLLTREEEYVEEGSFMHHCVASYADKDKSMIISMRTEDNSDRVTVEYDIQTGKPIQKRSFCNAQPPKHFNYPILVLDEKIKKLARWGLLNWKEKKKVPVKINGIEITPEVKVTRVDDIFAGYRLPF